jgi:Ran GTPase-activating protein (RanGAP) involved in mRNA processing and transport
MILLSHIQVCWHGNSIFDPFFQLNPVVARLDLSRNQVADAGMIALADAIKISDSLLYLFLYGNAFGPAGAVAIGDALRLNRMIRLVDISQNYIGAAGGASLGEALRVNRAIVELNLSFAQLGPGKFTSTALIDREFSF